MGHEFDTSYLIEQAQKDGKCIFIPKTYSQGRMDFVEYNLMIWLKPGLEFGNQGLIHNLWISLWLTGFMSLDWLGI